MNDPLTVKQAAAFTGLAPSTIYDFLATGRIPCTRYSRKSIRIEKEDLREFQGAHEVNSVNDAQRVMKLIIKESKKKRTTSEA